MAKTRAGRPTIFPGKVKSAATTVWGQLTPDGAKAFQRQRVVLSKLTGWPLARVSDSDVVEFLSRGADNSGRFIAAAKD